MTADVSGWREERNNRSDRSTDTSGSTSQRQEGFFLPQEISQLIRRNIGYRVRHRHVDGDEMLVVCNHFEEIELQHRKFHFAHFVFSTTNFIGVSFHLLPKRES